MPPPHYLLWLCLGLNCTLTLWNVISGLWQAHGKKFYVFPQKSYSYVGSDYPLEYPMPPLDTVAMTLQESLHFDLNLNDSVAEQEWELLVTQPKGFGRTRLGPNHRMFVITHYHQFHCLRKIEVGLLDKHHNISTPHHAQHCFNYLRQTLLCDANDSVEEGDFMLKNHDQDRMGDTLACLDWERAYDIWDQNYASWLDWTHQWN